MSPPFLPCWWVCLDVILRMLKKDNFGEVALVVPVVPHISP